MEDVGIFYRLVHFTAFCYILRTFGIVRGNLVFFPVLVFCLKKNLATLGLNEETGTRPIQVSLTNVT
jgi:hypothetical protein